MYDDYMKQKLMMIIPSQLDQPSFYLGSEPVSGFLTNLKDAKIMPIDVKVRGG